VPTDPFVNPTLDDAPRHRQNLPPGIGYPPARRGSATRRAAALGVDQPRGGLFGAPGPNVGYALTLARRAAATMQLGAHEHVDDAVAVVAEIAMRRAASFGRAPVIGDIELAAGLLGYDGTAGDTFVAARTAATHHASHDSMVRRRLVNSVPDDLLRIRPAEAASRASAWRTSLFAESDAESEFNSEDSGEAA
jgi:hypothetical protein